MKLGISNGLETGNWLADEIADYRDFLYLSEAMYENWSALAAVVAHQGDETKDKVVAGLALTWNSAMQTTLGAGVAVSFTGKYFTLGAWGFVSASGDVFAVVVPLDQTITFDTGGASDRIDMVEIRPIREAHNSQSREFRDPITHLITTAPVNTRYRYTCEVQVKKGTEGAGVALAKTAGWIKVAEVLVGAGVSALTQDKIKGVNRSPFWTTDASATKKPGLYYAGDPYAQVGVPIGAIIAHVPGYFTDGVNGGYTPVAVTLQDCWKECDGTALYDAESPIFNSPAPPASPNRYLPHLHDDRFLMGSTTPGTPGGSNNLGAHTHAFTQPTAASHNHLWYYSTTNNSYSYDSAGVVEVLLHGDIGDVHNRIAKINSAETFWTDERAGLL